jgi:hypothetical protein
MRRGTVGLLIALLWFSCDFYDELYLKVDVPSGFYNGAGGERVSFSYDYTPGMNQQTVLNLYRINGTADQFMETFFLTPGDGITQELDAPGDELGTGGYMLQEFTVFNRGGRISYDEGQAGQRHYFVVNNSNLNPDDFTYSTLIADVYSEYENLGYPYGHGIGYLRLHHPLGRGLPERRF